MKQTADQRCAKCGNFSGITPWRNKHINYKTGSKRIFGGWGIKVPFGSFGRKHLSADKGWLIVSNGSSIVQRLRPLTGTAAAETGRVVLFMALRQEGKLLGTQVSSVCHKKFSQLSPDSIWITAIGSVLIAKLSPSMWRQMSAPPTRQTLSPSRLDCSIPKNLWLFRQPPGD